MLGFHWLKEERMNNKENKNIVDNKPKENNLTPPKNFNPRISKANLNDERFFAFEAQKSHH